MSGWVKPGHFEQLSSAFRISDLLCLCVLHDEAAREITCRCDFCKKEPMGIEKLPK
jgi:hypothetical protein